MLKMRVVTVYFPNPNSDVYARQLSAFVSSCKACGIVPEVIKIDTPQLTREKFAFDANHAKLKAWVDSAKKDETTIFMDCDMLVLKNFKEAENQVQHIGICRRHLTAANRPFNGGFVVCKGTTESLDMLRAWYDKDCEMMRNISLHMAFRKKYAGINQASFGWLIENGYSHLVAWLPDTYNFCSPNKEAWKQAHVVHCKGLFRRWMTKPHCSTLSPAARELMDIYKRHEENGKREGICNS
jgi:hypothetical protein